VIHEKLPPGVALAWGELPAPRRGPKPAHSVEEIIAAAVALADAHGIDGVSLPKLGARLGISANALYRYLASKDELLVLLTEVGWGPPPPDLAGHADWRSGAEAWTRALMARLHSRPWLLDIPIRSAPVTPNLVAWLETLLRMLASTGLSHADQLGCATLLDGFARRAATLARDLPADGTPPTQARALAAFLLPRLEEKGYPLLADVISGRRYSGPPADSAEFGLRCILDGIESIINQQRKAERGKGSRQGVQ
jgi:AcrR family transcriptional regulator